MPYVDQLQETTEKLCTRKQFPSIFEVLVRSKTKKHVEFVMLSLSKGKVSEGDDISCDYPSKKRQLLI